MSQSQFIKFLDKPWYKRKHGLQLINGRLFCNLCMVPVAQKFGQHLVGDKHRKNYDHS